MDVTTRQKIEREIAMRVVHDLITNGYEIRVHDGEATTLQNSTDKNAIEAALFTTDEDYVYAMTGNELTGWVRFVYGNDGWDVINDYTVNLESVLTGANALAVTYA